MESIVKEKTKYEVEKSIYETTSTFSSFNKISKILIFIFLLGSIPAYYISKLAATSYFTKSYESFAFSAKPSSFLASSLVVSNVTIFDINEAQFAASADILNPNLDLAVGSSPYLFTFFDSAGQEVFRVKDSFFMYPNEKKVLVVPRIEKKLKPVSAKLSIENPKFIKRITTPEVRLETQKPIITNQFEPFGLSIDGDVLNNSPYTLKLVKVRILLYNQSGRVVAATSTEQSALKPFEKRAYKIIYPGIWNFNATRAEVFADTDVFNPENIAYQVQ